MLSIFKKKSVKFNCYTSIKELPIEIWFSIHETGDLLLLFKDQKEAFLTDKLNDLFDTIYNEFLDKFGLSDDYLSELEERKQIALLQADLIITGHKHLKTLIEVSKQSETLIKKKLERPNDLGRTLAQLGKYYGYHLNEKISVYQYYSHINAIPKHG
jgi:hypothetical protein